MDTNLEELARTLGQVLNARGWMLATAESCTGGWIAEAVTDISDSSAWLDRGFVTCGNDAKQDMLCESPRNPLALISSPASQLQIDGQVKKYEASLLDIHH